MATARDLGQLRRLLSLCDVQQRLALQAQQQAAQRAMRAEERKHGAEAAVARAHDDWQRMLASETLVPELARAAGAALLADAATLKTADDDAASAHAALGLAQEQRAKAEARRRQIEARLSDGRRMARNHAERRAVERVEDRTTADWRKR